MRQTLILTGDIHLGHVVDPAEPFALVKTFWARPTSSSAISKGACTIRPSRWTTSPAGTMSGPSQRPPSCTAASTPSGAPTT